LFSKPNHMLFKNKNAIIYGAGGSMAGAVAKALAAAGAKVFLTGLHLASVKKLADEIIASGGEAYADEVDAMDAKSISSHIDKVLKQSDSIDISFNAIALQDKQGIALVEMDMADFVRPVNIAVQTHFLTATAAARVMIKQQSGVILMLTATPAAIAYPFVGGFGTACCAMENFAKHLASEVGQYGVRAVNIRSGGSPDSRVFKEAIAQSPEIVNPILRKMEEDTMLKKLPLMEDIANAAVFLTSDMAAKITGTTIDLTCGTTAGLNYKVEVIPFKD
jgi:3-oxoacyl-[acyl-carrier protein] reductase